MKKTERQIENETKQEVFAVELPKAKKKKDKFTTQKLEKTSLYVDSDILFDSVKFKKAKLSKDILISKDTSDILHVIFKHGKIGKRYGENGLEDDPSKQQIIIYAAVKCNGHILWYQRASKKSVSSEKKKNLGDPRLQGKYSIGFGGHKTKEDIELSREDLIFLSDLLPAIKNEVGTMLGLNRGLFSEVEEELGITKEHIKSIKFLGAFHDKRIEDPAVDIQVGWVHTGIATVIEIDDAELERLVLRKIEIANAWWTPQKSVEKELNRLTRDFSIGKGPQVEGWTEIFIKEFL